MDLPGDAGASRRAHHLRSRPARFPSRAAPPRRAFRDGARVSERDTPRFPRRLPSPRARAPQSRCSGDWKRWGGARLSALPARVRRKSAREAFPSCATRGARRWGRSTNPTMEQGRKRREVMKICMSMVSNDRKVRRGRARVECVEPRGRRKYLENLGACFVTRYSPAGERR